MSLVKTPTAQEPFVPMFMIHAQYDTTVPHHQLDDMLCTLESKNVPPELYKATTLFYTDLHSFHYWQSCDQFPYGGQCQEVRQDVINFLDAHLK